MQSLKKKLLGLAALGAFAAIPLTSSMPNAQADPPRHAPAWGHRDKNRNDHRRNDRNNYSTFVGVVTDLKSGLEFDMKSNGRTYNVYPVGNTRRRASRGDTVRVTGVRVGNNGIRNARVEILRHNR
jgi:hypothetical protein